jgi:Ubiquitin carboxyl-terminal hydrolase
MVFDKDVKGAPVSSSWKALCVGLGNKSANCWTNAFLQFVFHSEELTQAFHTVGEFYYKNKELPLEKRRIDDTLKHFQGKGPISEDRLKDGIKLFCKVRSPYQKLVALGELVKAGRAPVAEKLIQTYLPKNYRKALEKLQEKNNLSDAIQILLKNQASKETQRQKDLQIAGQYLLAAEHAYRMAIQKAVETGKAPKALSGEVSQSIRLALHYLFGISPNQNSFQDATEPLTNLLARYEDILSADQRISPLNYILETKKTYDLNTPGNPRQISGNRSAMVDGAVAVNNPEYQIMLEMPDVRHSLLMDDFLRNYFQSTFDGPISTLLTDDGFQEKDYRCIAEQRTFVGPPPPSLNLVIKRNGYREEIGDYKIKTPLIIHRVIALPGSAFRPNVGARAYELSSFIVHTGGHYVAYRNINGVWVEFDDASVRSLSDNAIDRILRGSKAYMLDYKLVPASRQTAMLKEAETLKTKYAPSVSKPKENATLPHKTLIEALSKLDTIVKKNSHSSEILEAMESLKKVSPRFFDSLCVLVAISNGQKTAAEGEKILFETPYSLYLFKEPVIRATKETIVSQLLRRELEKIPLQKCDEEIDALEQLLKEKPSQQIKKLIAEREVQYEKLSKKYFMENLRSFQALLRENHLSKQQIAQNFMQIDLSATLRNQIYERVASQFKVSKEEGQKLFMANPRILLESSSSVKKKQDTLDPDDDLSALFSNLNTKTVSSSQSIIDDLIDSLKK